jgi:hypothetical protein
MTLKAYLTIMAVATIAAWSLLGYLIYTVNPFATNLAGLLLFYSALFVALTGLSSILGFIIRFAALKQALLFRIVATAFRQSFLFAFLICAALFLLSKNLFSWTNLVLLAVSLAVLEFFIAGWLKARSI